MEGQAYSTCHLFLVVSKSCLDCILAEPEEGCLNANARLKVWQPYSPTAVMRRDEVVPFQRDKLKYFCIFVVLDLKGYLFGTAEQPGPG